MSIQELISRLRERAMSCAFDLRFLLNFAADKLEYQQKRIFDLECENESLVMELEDERWMN